MEEEEEPPDYCVCWGLTGLSSPPPPVEFKKFYENMIEEMKVLVPEITEPGYLDGALLDMWSFRNPRGKRSWFCMKLNSKLHRKF